MQRDEKEKMTETEIIKENLLILKEYIELLEIHEAKKMNVREGRKFFVYLLSLLVEQSKELLIKED